MLNNIQAFFLLVIAIVKAIAANETTTTSTSTSTEPGIY